MGLDYFPMEVKDCEKIKFIKRKYKLNGIGLINTLFKNIFEKGYFLDISDYWKEDFCLEYEIEEEYLNNFLEDCCKRKIFDYELYEKNLILTSKGIQKQYIKSTERRKENSMIKYLLVDVNKMYTEKKPKGVNVYINETEQDKCIQDVDINEQSKIKENKINKSKLNNNTDSNESKSFSFTLNRLTQFDNLSIKYIEELKKYIAKVNCGMSFDKFKESCIMKGYKYKNFKMAYDKWNNVKQKEQEENKIGIYEQTILEIRQRHEEEEAERKLQEELDKNRTDDKPF